jgi:hypothetical protein
VYVIPIIVLALIVVVGTAWSPIFALIIAVPAFALFLAYVGMSRRTDEKAPPPNAPAGTRDAAEEEDRSGPSGGLWGERRA